MQVLHVGTSAEWEKLDSIKFKRDLDVLVDHLQPNTPGLQRQSPMHCPAVAVMKVQETGTSVEGCSGTH